MHSSRYEDTKHNILKWRENNKKKYNEYQKQYRKSSETIKEYDRNRKRYKSEAKIFLKILLD